MTTPVTNTPPSTGPAAPISSAMAGGAMGKNEFIKLLVAQMTHQDPLNPMDGQAMAAQLAQFSSVEQLMNIGAKLDAQASGNAALLGVVNNSAAMNLLGKTVDVATDRIEVGPNGTATAKVSVPGDGGPVELRIVDSAGNTVRTLQSGSLRGGDNTIDIADAADGLSNGEYRIEIDCDQDGEVINLVPLIPMTVEGVRFGSDGALITSGGRTYPVSMIAAITANS